MPGILGLSRNSTAYVVVVALAVCLVCSIVVSAAAVYLKPLQASNAKADRRRNILAVAELMEPGADVNAVFRERIDARIVDLSTGRYAPGVEPAKFDQRAAARDPEQSIDIAADEDPAGIKRRAKHAEVYLVRDQQGQVQTVVLPIHGYGLWSTMYGFIAVKPDGNTVSGINFYEQGETPGLGAEVTNPKWQAIWEGKKIYGDDGEVQLRVIKGAVSPESPGAEHKVDGLSGATLTSRGVSGTIAYWFSERGFKPYLQNLAQGNLDQG